MCSKRTELNSVFKWFWRTRKKRRKHMAIIFNGEKQGRNSKLRQTKCSPNVSPFVGKQNAFMMGRQSLDLTKQQKNNIWSCIQIPRFSRVLTILIWIKVQNVLDASNFPKTQPTNSLKVLKHTFSSVKVKHFSSFKKR